MNTTTTNQTDGGAGQREPEAPITEKLSEDVAKGLSQPPSRAQVPPATAAEEIVQ